MFCKCLEDEGRGVIHGEQKEISKQEISRKAILKILNRLVEEHQWDIVRQVFDEQGQTVELEVEIKVGNDLVKYIYNNFSVGKRGSLIKYVEKKGFDRGIDGSGETVRGEGVLLAEEKEDGYWLVYPDNDK